MFLSVVSHFCFIKKVNKTVMQKALDDSIHVSLRSMVFEQCVETMSFYL